MNNRFVGALAASLFCVALSARAEKDLYCVIDLSAGPNAKSYPVSYMDAEPQGGWTQEYKTNKMVFRKIPAGKFVMGSPKNELGRDTNEDQHEVTLTKPFYMGVFEVTQKQWKQICGKLPSMLKGDDRPADLVSFNMIRGEDKGSQWPLSDEVDADSLVGRLRARTKLAGIDLPTEAQWEYACRAGTTAALNNGMNLTNDTSDASMNDISRNFYTMGDKRGGGTTKSVTVGSYKPNAWGLYDMHGNLWEFCLDWMAPYDLKDNVDPKGPKEGRFRVLRGGSWFDRFVRYNRSAFRHFFPVERRDWSYGCRLTIQSR